MAELLLARGHIKAAAVLAMSEYRADRVDNWDGGQFETVLSVPAALFDVVADDLREQMHDAARDVTGPTHFAGLVVEVRLADPAVGWDRDLLDSLRDTAPEPPPRPPLQLLGGASAD
jgi:hypothetical protein